MPGDCRQRPARNRHRFRQWWRVNGVNARTGPLRQLLHRTRLEDGAIRVPRNRADLLGKLVGCLAELRGPLDSLLPDVRNGASNRECFLIRIGNRALRITQPALGIDQPALDVDQPALGIRCPLRKRRVLGGRLRLDQRLAHGLGLDRSAKESQRPGQTHERTRPLEHATQHRYPEHALHEIADAQSANVDAAPAAFGTVTQRAKDKRTGAACQQHLQSPLAFGAAGRPSEDRLIRAVDELARFRRAEIVEGKRAFVHDSAGMAILHVTSSATTPIECGARPGTTSNVSARSHQS